MLWNPLPILFFFLLWIGKSVPIEPLCATVMAHINSTTAFLDGQHHRIQLFLACCVSGNALVESLHIILFSRNIFGSCGIGASWWGEVQLHIQCYHHRIVPTRIPESNTRPHTEPLQTPNPMSECCPNKKKTKPKPKPTFFFTLKEPCRTKQESQKNNSKLRCCPKILIKTEDWHSHDGKLYNSISSLVCLFVCFCFLNHWCSHLSSL